MIILIDIDVWIHYSYVKWIYEFMSIWIQVHEFKNIDSEFLYEFINIWIQI